MILKKKIGHPAEDRETLKQVAGVSASVHQRHRAQRCGLTGGLFSESEIGQRRGTSKLFGGLWGIFGHIKSSVLFEATYFFLRTYVRLFEQGALRGQVI